MLEIRDLHVNHGSLKVVQGASLMLRESETVCVVGANGAGKTTMLKALSGLIPKASGRILFLGQDITQWPPDKIVQSGLIHVPEGKKLFSGMSVAENLILGSYTRGAKKNRKQNLEKAYDLLPDLYQKRKELAGNLSGGQQQMVAIGRGLMSDPKLMVFDEPSIGLSPILTDRMFQMVEAVQKMGVSLLLVEQNVQHALRISNRGYVLEQGRITMSGPAAELLTNEHLKTAYLGI